MGLCQSCFEQDSKNKNVKNNLLASTPNSAAQTTAPKPQPTIVTGNKAKERRENSWKATGIIGLRDQQLREVPEAALQVTNATVLDASNNKLKALPDAISNLASLQRLVVSHNLLASLPPSLCTLASLKLINLDNNKLTELPAALGSLTALERLSAANNALTTLPPSLAAMAGLRVLAVPGNCLAALPPALPPALEEVDAAGNEVQVIPASLSSLHKLKVLNLDNNRVSDIPPEVLDGCVALHTLSLHGNPITPDTLQANPAFKAFEERRQQKYNKVIAGGVLMGARGMDEGVDRKATRSP